MTPRPAATICLLRDGRSGIEVLMAQRSATARFMAGVWVFPGGAVDDEDGAVDGVVAGPEADRAWRAAALRELVEEMGIWLTTKGVEIGPVSGEVYRAAAERGLILDGWSLGYFANWITPPPLPIRFDTRFFAAVADADPWVDGEELVAAAWVGPADAIARADAGAWEIAFPTARTLAHLASFPSTAAAMAHIAAMERVPSIQPRLGIEDGAISVLLPGQPGFEDAPDAADLARLIAEIGPPP